MRGDNGNGMGATLVQSKCRYRPVGGQLMVRQVKDSASRGGILMPESIESTFCEGIVIVLGPGRLWQNAHGPDDRIAPSVKLGDRVVYTRHAAGRIDPDAPDIYIVGEDSIIAVRTE